MADVAPQMLPEEGPPSPSASEAPMENAPPQPATPEEMPTNDRRQTAAADEAVMGATGDLDNVGGFEVYDESGELVKGLFFKFLLEL
jgi:hypothetical protein